MEALTIAVHWVHVLFSIRWFGSILFTRMELFPTLRELPEGYEKTVRGALTGRPNARRNTMIMAWGTVLLGALRGLLDGVHTRLDTPYGLTYLTALAVGLVMVVWLGGPWLKREPFYKLYVAGFPVMFTLMVLMRFGY